MCDLIFAVNCVNQKVRISFITKLKWQEAEIFYTETMEKVAWKKFIPQSLAYSARTWSALLRSTRPAAF